MTWGSAIHHKRDMHLLGAGSRRRCNCGCKTRATHRGDANGVTLVYGCEMYMRRWVRDGVRACTPSRRPSREGSGQ